MTASTREEGSASSVVLVAEQGAVVPEVAGQLLHRLDYQFIDEFPEDGFSGWVVEKHAKNTLVEVAEYCRAGDAGFIQQALNRVVAQAIVKTRPRLLVVSGFWGCTLDLPRIARLMGVACVFIPFEALDELEADYDEHTQSYIVDVLQSCSAVVGDDSCFSKLTVGSEWLPQCNFLDRSGLEDWIESKAHQEPSPAGFDYSLYEFVMRDHPLLTRMQQPDVKHFQTADAVLDVGCGSGIFLDLLRRNGVEAMGVERNAAVAEYGCGMGLNIINDDALQFLRNDSRTFDGIYCSHFVEHLPIEAVQELLQLIARRLNLGGTLVLVFPDPESIRSQLLGFWRDPEHVRFYHPELIISIALALGFDVEWSSYDEQAHKVVPFAEQPPIIPEVVPLAPLQDSSAVKCLGILDKVLAVLGLVSIRRMEALEQRLLQWSELLSAQSEQQLAAGEALCRRTDHLWDVNQTWAWHDNVTIKLRKVSHTV